MLLLFCNAAAGSIYGIARLVAATGYFLDFAGAAGPVIYHHFFASRYRSRRRFLLQDLGTTGSAGQQQQRNRHRQTWHKFHSIPRGGKLPRPESARKEFRG